MDAEKDAELSLGREFLSTPRLKVQFPGENTNT